MSNPSEINEAELIALLQEGTQSAFNQVYRLFQPSLVFFANRLLLGGQDIMDAEELVQDVFVRFYHRRTTFESLSHLRSFLYLATKNACLDKLAKDKVRMRRFETFIADFDETEEAILAQITYSELMREINQAIDLLPDKCRHIMKQFLDEGKNAQEIAADLDVTVSTVNNQKSRGISILRRKLSQSSLAFLLTLLLP